MNDLIWTITVRVITCITCTWEKSDQIISWDIIDYHWLSENLKNGSSYWLTDSLSDNLKSRNASASEKETKIFALWILDQNCGWTSTGFQYLHDK